MPASRVLLVIDMQNGVFENPRINREICTSRINQLIQAAEEGLEPGSEEFVVCGCATDYCVDSTIKNGASRGYAITVAEDAHTTANRPAVLAEALIAHYNDVWRNFTIPGNTLLVKSTADILAAW